MPSTFTGAFAKRLDKSCAVSVKEAEHGDQLQAGSVHITPGGKLNLPRKKRWCSIFGN